MQYEVDGLLNLNIHLRNKFSSLPSILKPYRVPISAPHAPARVMQPPSTSNIATRGSLPTSIRAWISPLCNRKVDFVAKFDFVIMPAENTDVSQGHGISIQPVSAF